MALEEQPVLWLHVHRASFLCDFAAATIAAFLPHLLTIAFHCVSAWRRTRLRLRCWLIVRYILSALYCRLHRGTVCWRDNDLICCLLAAFLGSSRCDLLPTTGCCATERGVTRFASVAGTPLTPSARLLPAFITKRLPSFGACDHCLAVLCPVMPYNALYTILNTALPHPTYAHMHTALRRCVWRARTRAPACRPIVTLRDGSPR